MTDLSLAEKVEGPRPFLMAEMTPHLVLYDGKICMQERCVQTGQIRYFDMTAKVAEALAPFLRAKGEQNGAA